MTNVIDGEFVDTRLAVRNDEPSTAVVLWGTDDPRGMTNRMGAVADAMAAVVRQRGLVQTFKISGVNRDYVKVEGWSLVGAMIGVFPHTERVEEIRLDDGSLIGFRAFVDLIARGTDGVVGGAMAICTRDEERWADRDFNQIASMAQTRATAKAYRMTLGFVMPMAGYEATPAEEMESVSDQGPRRAPRQSSKSPDEQQWERDNPPARGQRPFDDSRPPEGNQRIAAARTEPQRPTPAPSSRTPEAGRPLTPETIKTVTQLVQWAQQSFGMDQDDVLAACSVETLADVRELGLAPAIAKVVAWKQPSDVYDDDAFIAAVEAADTRGVDPETGVMPE